ncbi:DUF2777 family protein [Anaerobacillus sp. MEB173]|uniref:DUF2777 family protein n=1 Tax=Anaerobacillus sp. MEB173 TaxID=3383345 RepID=UPI003F8EE6F2
MNRKEAQNHIGKLVLVDELMDGRYIGELLEVNAEPRKPWRGTIKIVAVDTYPQHVIDKNGSIQLPKPVYEYGNIHEFQSSKIEPIAEEEYMKYDDSVYKSLQEEIEKYQTEREYFTSVLKVLHERIASFQPETDSIKELQETDTINDTQANEYVYYTISKENNQMILIEEENQQNLALDGCPFEFELEVNDEWESGYYINNGKFETKNGASYSLKEGQIVRLHKKQFDPYHILINELEKPALQALEKGLDTFGIDHEQCIQCHNTLLIQLLNTHQQTVFKGVNFITYHNGRQVLLVQHHYEREIIEDGNDITFDRFEFTSDNGKRTITTYSNEYTKGK